MNITITFRHMEGTDAAKRFAQEKVSKLQKFLRQAMNAQVTLSVEGLDAIYIGPSDLSLALGCKPVFDDVDAPVAQAIDHILARAQAHGVKAGIHNGRPDVAKARIAKGFRFVTVSSDARMLAAGSQELLAAMRKA